VTLIQKLRTLIDKTNIMQFLNNNALISS